MVYECSMFTYIFGEFFELPETILGLRLVFL